MFDATPSGQMVLASMMLNESTKGQPVVPTNLTTFEEAFFSLIVIVIIIAFLIYDLFLHKK